MDRISNLSDELIYHIGSFLSAKDAACANVLSRRWRNLFTIEPELCSSYMDDEDFTDFTDEVSALPVDSFIRRFNLIWDFNSIEPDHIDLCLSHVLKHGVVDLELDVTHSDEEEEDEEEEDEEDKYSLPLEVFTCNTVVKLNLGRHLLIEFIPAKAYLPALKSLILHSVRIYELDKLLSVCPVLEKFAIYDFKEWKGSRSVSSPTIKKLRLQNGFEDWGYYDELEFESFSFDTPALIYLQYLDFARKEYPIVNFNSLVEAELGIYKEEGTQSDPKNLFNGLKNVEILSVTDKTMELIHEFREAVPMFENLSQLTLVNKEEGCWSGLRVLLHKSPKLKTLTIKDSLHRNKKRYSFEPLCECLLGYSFLLTSRIEVLTIMAFRDCTGEMSHLKQILEKLPYLELLEIHIKVFDGDEEKKIKKNLLRLPRGSSKFKIQVVTKFAKDEDKDEEEEEDEEQEVQEEEEEEEEKEAKSGRCEAIIPKKRLRCKRSTAKGSKWCWQHKEKKTSSPEKDEEEEEEEVDTWESRHPPLLKKYQRKKKNVGPMGQETSSPGKSQ